jgi:type VI protein secretion system component Hcp
MASEQSNELLMRMVDSNGLYLGAECLSKIDPKSDDLAKDYNAGSFFSVDDFAFGMNIDDKDPTADTTNTKGREGVGVVAQNKPAGPEVKFGKWKSGSAEDIKAMIPFPLRMDEFSITRRYDRASPVLFEKCATSDSFQTASLIKRKTVGDKLQSFLRFDFEDVLVTHIDWQDAEVIKETIKFVFRKITVQYKTQAHSGKLDAAGSVSWNYNANLRKPAKAS